MAIGGALTVAGVADPVLRVHGEEAAGHQEQRDGRAEKPRSAAWMSCCVLTLWHGERLIGVALRTAAASERCV